MPDTSPPMIKRALRDHARRVRSSMTPAQIEEKSKKISRKLGDILNGMTPVMVYVSKPLEVNTRDLISDLIAQGKKVVVPIIEKDTKTLRLSYLDDPTLLTESTFHVPEPLGHELPAEAAGIKAVIIPMLAFDRKGNRLGYGAGYYDRFLSANPHLTRIGIAFSCQETSEIPCEENDMKMHMVVTENGIYHCSENSPQD